MMEWDQVPGGRSQQVLESQQSYETEWDMVNTVSFRKRPCSNTECESGGAAGGRAQQHRHLSFHLFPSVSPSGCLSHQHERNRWALSFNVTELKSVTVKKEGWTVLIFRLRDSPAALPALHLHQGGSVEFLDSLKRFTLLME